MAYGLLIDYKWCTGCHSCEIACQQAHAGYAPTEIGGPAKTGIYPAEIGPFELGNGKFQYEFLPTPTAFCDLCGERVAKGKEPTCVRHCQTACISYGPLEELAEKMTSKHMVLFR